MKEWTISRAPTPDGEEVRGQMETHAHSEQITAGCSLPRTSKEGMRRVQRVWQHPGAGQQHACRVCHGAQRGRFPHLTTHCCLSLSLSLSVCLSSCCRHGFRALSVYSAHNKDHLNIHMLRWEVHESRGGMRDRVCVCVCDGTAALHVCFNCPRPPLEPNSHKDP